LREQDEKQERELRKYVKVIKAKDRGTNLEIERNKLGNEGRNEYRKKGT
jgi:hypothetical protein